MIVRHGHIGLIVFAFLCSAGLFLAGSDRADAETWRVIDIDPAKRLHMREKPTTRSRVLGYIPGSARGLKGGSCNQKWCKLEYGGVIGWVYKRYLTADEQTVAKQENSEAAAGPALDALAQKQTLYLKPSNGRPVPVYAFPNDKLPTAGLLAADTKTVEGMGACIRAYCYVRSGPLIGWLPQAIFASSEETAGTSPQDEKVEEMTASLPPALQADEDQALNKTETTATNLAAPANPASVTAPTDDDDGNFYALAGVSGERSLAIHAKPDGGGAIVGWIPHGARKIEGLRKCVEQWCLVRWEGKSGWVARRHLADESIEGARSFQITGLTPWKPLEVLDQPSETASVVGTIPSYATGIVPIGQCNKYWCHIRYLGIAGWVRANFLKEQQARR